jgi:hypothetical protein
MDELDLNSEYFRRNLHPMCRCVLPKSNNIRLNTLELALKYQIYNNKFQN